MGAWIETRLSQYFLTSEGSPLAWGRGLKHHQSENQETQKTSPLAWGRGLKHISVGTGIICTGRPRAGAWIETLVTSLFGENTRVASRVGRGLKRIRRRVIRIRRPSRGGVD